MPRWTQPHHAPVPSRRVFGPYLRAALSGLRRGAGSDREHPGGGHLHSARAPSHPRSLAAAFAGRLDGRDLHPARTGRHALWRFLQSVDWAPGDQVLVSAYNFWVVVALLVQAGLEPVFVDTDPQTLCMCPEDARRKRTDRTRMVLLTHMFGHPGPTAELAALCRAHGMLLFEDCAHAVGTTLATPAGPRHAGSLGHGALFSFGVYKSVSALGGGMLAVDPAAPLRLAPPPPVRPVRPPLAEQHVRAALSLMLQPPAWTLLLAPALARLPRLAEALDAAEPPTTFTFDPASRAPWHPFMGEAVARQLAVLEDDIARRRAIAAAVAEAVAGRSDARALEGDTWGRANGSYLGLWVDDPGAWARRLAAHGIEAKVHQFRNCAALPLFSPFAADCPGAAALDAHLLRLPSFPHMRPAALQRMLAALRRS